MPLRAVANDHLLLARRERPSGRFPRYFRHPYSECNGRHNRPFAVPNFDWCIDYPRVNTAIYPKFPDFLVGGREDERLSPAGVCMNGRVRERLFTSYCATPRRCDDSSTTYCCETLTPIHTAANPTISELLFDIQWPSAQRVVLVACCNRSGDETNLRYRVGWSDGPIRRLRSPLS